MALGKQLYFSDTTLRDGEQMPGARFSIEAKVAVAKALADMRVDSIEAGFPASSPSEIAAVRAVARHVEGPLVMALCRTLTSDIDAADAAFEGIPRARCGVNLFLGTSPLHRDHKLRKNKAELLGIIGETVAYAKRSFRFVSFSAEDASRTELDFLCSAYDEALSAGANAVGFPDTVGILTPEQVRRFIVHIREHVKRLRWARLAVHFHNDLGLAVANTLAAVSEGADVVQSTVNGLGERAGNAALEEVAVALRLHEDQYARPFALDIARIAAVSRLVADSSGVPISATKPIVGRNVFATEAGLHQDGVLKHVDTYLPFRPELVGFREGVRIVLGKQSGRSAVAEKIRTVGATPSPELVDAVFDRMKASSGAEFTDDQLVNTIAEFRARTP
jgi:2-isopropylmalate synthase